MANKLPPTSGLDYEAVITEIDNQEELKKETGNFDRQIEQMHKTARDLEASCEALIIEALGMDETTAAIQELTIPSCLETQLAVNTGIRKAREESCYRDRTRHRQ